MHSPKPWYRRSNDSWYVQIGPEQIRLAKGKDQEPEALRQFYELMAQQDLAQHEAPALCNVASLCDLYLDWSERHHAPTTFDWYRRFLQYFCNQCGSLTLAQVQPFHVTRWMDAHNWNDSSRRAAICCVQGAFNWAVQQGYLSVSPLRSLKKPRPKRRERLVTPEIVPQAN